MEKDGKIEEQARLVCEPIVSSFGFKLWDVLFEKDGAMWYLRILFDKEGGISTDECEKITEPLNAEIDKQSWLDAVDIVEIGSPGLSKRLRKAEHFEACLGEPIRVTVRGEKGKQVGYNGTLKSFDKENNAFTLDIEGTEKAFSISECLKVNSDL